MKHLIIIILAMACMVSSCEKTINLEGTEIDPKITVNSFFYNDSLLSVYVHKSSNITEILELTALEKAVVKVFDNETKELIEKLSYSGENGLYKGNLKAKIGSKYSITVEHPDYTNVSCESECPDTVKNVNFTNISATNQWGGKTSNITLDFDNISSNKPHYYLLIHRNNVYNNGKYNYSNKSHLSTKDINIANHIDRIGDEESYLEYILINSDKFPTNKISVKFSVPYDNYTFNNPSGENYTDYVSELTIFTCSYEILNYLNTLEKQKDAKDNPFTQPVQLETNINNGLGIFGCLSAKKVILDSQRVRY